MSTHKYIDKICVGILIFAVVLTVLFMNGERFGVQVAVDEDAETYSDSIYFTTNDLDGEWDTSDATTITLNGTDCEVDGQGVYSYDGNVVIATTGKYVISGTLDDGSIVVDAYDASKVWILLDGVSVNCNDDAAFRVDQADKVFLTLADGTENTFTSGEEYSDEALEDGTDGAIFAHDDLTVNGSGSLYVVANYRHGIEANDDLVITGGTIAIDAPEDAININNNFRMRDAYVSLACEDDGLVVKKEADGYLYMESGTLNIESGNDGIHTAGDITIEGGDLTIAAGDDGIHSDTAVAVSDGSIQISECYEGIEAVTIDIAGGDIEIYPTDDGINANGGSGDMMGGPGGMGGGPQDWDGNATPSRASESNVPDDGNATDTKDNISSDGTDVSDGNADPQMPPQMSASESNVADANQNADTGDSADDEEDEETYVKISGGTVTIVNETGQDADGIDSNGDIFVTGGTIRVSLPGDGSNNAFDYGSENDGVSKIDGGNIVACGGAAMLEEMSSDSEQCSIMYNTEETVAAGTAVGLRDADGNLLLSYDVPCSFSSVILSCPEMEQGETYQVLVGGAAAEDVSMDETAMTVGSTQNNMGGPGGGMGGRGGGMRQGGPWEQQGDDAATPSTADGQEDWRQMKNAASPSTADGQEGWHRGDEAGQGGGDQSSTDGNEATTSPSTTSDGSNMQMPQGNGGPPGFEEESEDETEEEEVAVDTRTDIREMDSETWALLGASAAAMIAGLIFVRIYKRRSL